MRFEKLSRRLGDPPLPEPMIRVFQMPPEEIGYLTNIVEAYDGIGLVRTLDRTRGIIELWIMPDYTETFDELLEAMRLEFPIQPLGPEFD